MLRNNFKLIIDIILIELGLIISSFGIALFYASNLGAGAMATFSDGLHLALNISYGTANTIANIFLLIMLVLLERRYVNIGTLLCVFTIGPWIDVFTRIFSFCNFPEATFWIRVVISAGGTILLGTGLGIYAAVGRGLGALEGLVNYFSKKAKISITISKIIQDTILVIIGLFWGAPWGVGTIMSILLSGPVYEKSIKCFANWYSNLKFN